MYAQKKESPETRANAAHPFASASSRASSETAAAARKPPGGQAPVFEDRRKPLFTVPGQKKSATASKIGAKPLSVTPVPPGKMQKPATAGTMSPPVSGPPDAKTPARKSQPLTDTRSLAADLSAAGPDQVATGFGSLGSRVSAALSKDRKNTEARIPPVSATIKGVNGEHGTPSGTADQAPPPPPPPVAVPYQRPGSGVTRGDVPRFSPTGEADPGKAEQESSRSAALVRDRYREISGQMAANPGEARIRPRSFREQGRVQLADAKTEIKTRQTRDMAAYLQLPKNVREAVGSKQINARMAEAGNKIRTAMDDRENRTDEAVQKTRTQADALAAKAKTDQKVRISLARTDIAGQKQKVREDARNLVKEYDDQVGAGKQKTLETVNTRIIQSEKHAEKELNQADARARRKQAEADRRVAEEKRKAEEKKKNRKWYQKIGDFFAAIGRALKKAVSSIISAVKNVVKGIIRAAKALVNGIINACAKIVTGLIKAFAALVKTLTNGLLAAFPALRDKLNAYIDAAVEKATSAIDKLAEALKKGIESLAATLNKAVDLIARAAEALVSGGIAMLGALLAGDFRAMARIAFETACQMAGVPPAKMWEMLKKAGARAMDIIRNPKPFFRNLFAAVSKGFKMFTDNLWQHLKGGLMSWLVGQVAVAGVAVPAKLTASALFSLFRAVLGINYETVKARATAIIGAEKVEKLEKVLSIIKDVFVTGPAAIWKMVKKFAAGLKQKLFGKILNWGIVKVAQKAMTKIASLFVPGLGLVQAVLGIWKLVKFFIDKGRHILSVVAAVFNSIREIAEGQIDKAAQYIFQSILAVLPLVFSFLARLVGLGDLSKVILGFINWLRKPVFAVIDKTVRFLWNLGKGIVNFFKGKKKGETTGKKPGVKDEVQKHLKDKTGKPFKSRKEAESMLEKAEMKYKPKGLDDLTLSIKPVKGDNVYQVWATASPKEPSGLVTIQNGEYGAVIKKQQAYPQVLLDGRELFIDKEQMDWSIIEDKKPRNKGIWIRAKMYRTFDRNLGRIRGKGRKPMLLSIPRKLHTEPRLIAKFYTYNPSINWEDLNSEVSSMGKRDHFSIYTEREPCPTCRGHLEKAPYRPEDKVYYTIDYGHTKKMAREVAEKYIKKAKEIANETGLSEYIGEWNARNPGNQRTRLIGKFKQWPLNDNQANEKLKTLVGDKAKEKLEHITGKNDLQ